MVLGAARGAQLPVGLAEVEVQRRVEAVDAAGEPGLPSSFVGDRGRGLEGAAIQASSPAGSSCTSAIACATAQRCSGSPQSPISAQSCAKCARAAARSPSPIAWAIRTMISSGCVTAPTVAGRTDAAS